MKIVVLGFTKIKYMPYMHFYLNQIDRKQNEIHLIYWKRDNNLDSDIPDGITGHKFQYSMSDALPLQKKLPGILKYGLFAKKVIKEVKPDFLIVLHSTTGISIYNLLMRKYSGRYIFDYRDVTYEHISVYGKMVRQIASNSALCFTSSDGFRKYLPESPRPLNSHNITNTSFREAISDILPRQKRTPIRISFWGLLRNKQINEALIERLGNDKRFELHYYGRAQGNMLELMEDSIKKYRNVFFHGEYKPEDRLEMARNTDIIHNLYNASDKTSHIAMGNKYYDGLLFSLPQLCTVGSLMGKLASQHGIGYECNPFESDFADNVYQYYMNLNEQDFLKKSDCELARVLDEVEYGNQKIREVIHNA